MEEKTKDRKAKSPLQPAVYRTSITCTNMPESLFDAITAKRHFGKFGRVTKILLRPKKQTCVIDYDTQVAAERALLNAGAYDGFMFDVTWTKRKRKRSKKEDDPDWLPDSDVEEELTAMGETVASPGYATRTQTTMDVVKVLPKVKPTVVRKQSPAGKRLPVREKPLPSQQAVSGPETPAATVTSLSTAEAAVELRKLRTRVSLTPDEQRRTLDARDRILRAWGGAGARVVTGGATIGTCPDMCPEKERLQRQAEHQVMNLEAVPGSDGVMSERQAVKQYSRSSADQEMPMCYELRPPHVLKMTMAYLLHEIADSKQQVSLADWFHFMWDRFRGIRKDITQQALCCAESVRLVEQCARFHAHCAARLADLEHTQFDQRLNTDNLTKCLQSLKHMYADLDAVHKPREAEFRGYIALLNLGDANFWWEIKQLPQEIQKSADVCFAVQVFNALDNNNYVRFFRLVRDKATYLQACILLRYFNDVRARALARIVKAFAPRGGSRYPAEDIMEALAFENVDNMKSFINHYGLRFSKHPDSTELTIILDRNQFIEDSDPYPVARAVGVIETKQQCSVAAIVSGGLLPDKLYAKHNPHSSFNDNGQLKASALVAEDQFYSTRNDSNKSLQALISAIDNASQTEFGSFNNSSLPKTNVFTKTEVKPAVTKPPFSSIIENNDSTKAVLFSFKPAIPVASSDISKTSDKIFSSDSTNMFSFSKPQEAANAELWQTGRDIVFEPTKKNLKDSGFGRSVLGNNAHDKNSITEVDGMFTKRSVLPKARGLPTSSATKENSIFKATEIPVNNVFGGAFNNNNSKNTEGSVFSKPVNSLFGSQNKAENTKSSVFAKAVQPNTNLFTQQMAPNVFLEQYENKNKSEVERKSLFVNQTETTNVFTKPNLNLFAKAAQNVPNVFSKPLDNNQDKTAPENIFGQANVNQFVFSKPSKGIFSENTSSQPTVFGNSTAKPVANLFGQPDQSKQKSDGYTFGSAKNVNIFTKPLNQPLSEQSGLAQSPASVFQSAFLSPAADSATLSSTKTQSIFQNQSTIKNDTTAQNLFASVQTQPAITEFNSPKEQQLQEEMQMQELFRKQAEEKRKLDEERNLAEKKRQELIIKEEKIRQELQRKAEQDRKENIRKQDELKKHLEEEKLQAAIKKLAEEEKRKADEEKKIRLEQIEKESKELVDVLSSEINEEEVKQMIKDEMNKFKQLMESAEDVNNDVISDVCAEICLCEIKAEMFWCHKLRKKWWKVWHDHSKRNIRRRIALEHTPVWISNTSPQQEACLLRRKIEPAVLNRMSLLHKGYLFLAQSKSEPVINPYDVVEIIRSSAVKRLKQIKYQPNKCFYWKVTLVSPGSNKWLNKKIELEKWLLQKFSDGKMHKNVSNLYVQKQLWNKLVAFAVSVSMSSSNIPSNIAETIDGTNGFIFYATEDDLNVIDRIEEHLKLKQQYHVVPLVVITACQDLLALSALEKQLSCYMNENVISHYKIFRIDRDHTFESLDSLTKLALKYVAKRYPPVPPIETDSLNNILINILGNELWHWLKLDEHGRLHDLLKDLRKVVQLYNFAVEMLTNIISKEDLLNYPNFPLEFSEFLEDSAMPYPKGFEFVLRESKTVNNFQTVKQLMHTLLLPIPDTSYCASWDLEIPEQIKVYCDQIGCIEHFDEIVCKAISFRGFNDSNMSLDESGQCCEDYNLLELMNVMVTKKIRSMNMLDKIMVVYNKTELYHFRNHPWWYEMEIVQIATPNVSEYEDDEIDQVIAAKRLKLSSSSEEYLAIEDRDITMVEESIVKADESIARYDRCSDAVKSLEDKLDEEVRKASELEALLKAALGGVY